MLFRGIVCRFFIIRRKIVSFINIFYYLIYQEILQIDRSIKTSVRNLAHGKRVTLVKQNHLLRTLEPEFRINGCARIHPKVLWSRQPQPFLPRYEMMKNKDHNQSNKSFNQYISINITIQCYLNISLLYYSSIQLHVCIL